ncbi:MAG: deoxyguanosinetriphosphate triphosphohydrolase [Lachnospiraceae bacterium]|jgi:dGTPase|nr:deoxyguanosinetriphosphate triphosphohydrolase [Lachnospiraceae bacterium]
MNIREQLEEKEEKILSKYASLSKNSKGRVRFEEPCDMRTIFQRDRDRILHCKSFRRLKQKTQVFLFPDGDHYRTRMTHTLEVSQIARTISKAIGLNEDLTEAIALGHDLGHTPFGHAGERVLNEISSTGFRHNEQSLRVVDKIERDGEGLNLSFEVRDGILNHKTSGKPATLEGQVVQISDKIAYINHDIDDAIRGGILNPSDIPRMYTDAIGYTRKERLDSLIHNIIYSSLDKPEIKMRNEVYEAMYGIRQYLFQNVYTNPKAKSEEKKAKSIIKALYKYFEAHTEMLPTLYLQTVYQEGIEPAVCDYIAGMTDTFAIKTYKDIFIPKAWRY